MFLKVSDRTVYQLLHTGMLEYRKIGRIYRITKKSVAKFMYEI